MKKAAKQTIISTLISYFGIAIGAFYTIFLIPKVFDSTPENYGAFVSLLNYVQIFVVFTAFSASYSILKYYPITAGKEREKMISFLLWINILGILLGMLVFYLYSQYHHIYITINGTVFDLRPFFYPLILTFTLFSFLQAYCQNLLEVAVPAFLSTTFTKIWMLGSLLLILFGLISLKVFSFLFFGQFIVSFLLLVVFVIYKAKDRISLQFQLPSNYKSILKYCFFALLVGSTAALITKVDLQMIGEHIGSKEVGFYAMAIFFMSVILVPKNMLNLVARSVVSKEFQKQGTSVFMPKYKHISLAFLIGTLIVFVGIIINIEELMIIMGSKFGGDTVKYSIIILGVGRVLESLFTLNTSVIEYSKYYRTGIIFELGALLLVITLNLLFIPLWGLPGVALSSTITYLASALSKSIFVYIKLRLTPLPNYIQFGSILLILSLALLYYFPAENMWVDSLQNPYSHLVTIALRSILFLFLLTIIIELTGIRKKYWNIKKLKSPKK